MNPNMPEHASGDSGCWVCETLWDLYDAQLQGVPLDPIDERELGEAGA